MNAKNSPAKRFFLAVSLLLYGAHALADSSAVQATNFQLGFASGDTYVSGSRDSNTYGINGSVTFPLLAYLGGSLSGAYAHTNLAANFPSETGTSTSASARPLCSVDRDDLAAGLFVRDPTIGRVGIGYGAGRTQSHCDATFLSTGTDTLETRNYAADAAYYFSKATLAIARTRTRLEAGGDLNSSTLTASWYPTNNARATLSAGGLDFKNTYSLGLDYQPEFLDNSLSLLFAYTARQQAIEARFLTIGLSYYFDKRVDLITRDRQYR
ncbi:MAG: hypothetical protein A2151_07315 [Candidatus Muproteobacteria bacterium RBG_16_65_34]|uniref:Outer membrane protein beta-barrel domain-containing protein n=1 Tax=Candidatus Muproteobacteria bacterium RBG_16_65_34 TaxID=1817760 RepID=A0A1F6TU67_9PROT|nr:MAG: hypothetical protein A2151_07315 [Candidatus Muproteobacteria bacterium RBG_16_65_34]